MLEKGKEYLAFRSFSFSSKMEPTPAKYPGSDSTRKMGSEYESHTVKNNKYNF